MKARGKLVPGKKRAPSTSFETGALSLESLNVAWQSPVTLRLTAADRTRVRRAAQVVNQIVRTEKATYGVNTGFGLLAQTRIPAHQLAVLQRNLVMSHAAGTGPLLPDPVVRLTLVLKIASLAQGYSGVRERTITALQKLLDHEIYPCMPAKGSVGASGDLAPLAHLSAALLGIGTVRVHGQVMPATVALERIGMKPMTLGPKEGLALLNGTQVSTALALAGLFAIRRVFVAALVAGAMSVDALKGSDVPFADRIHVIRRQRGQRRVAAVLRRLLAGSRIRASHITCDRVQDPYSVRCQPQVMGACLDLIQQVGLTLVREANAVTDNPLVFSSDRTVVSGGNFHAEPVAFAADQLALAIAEVGSISERRIALLVDPKMSGLPPFLVANSGVNSGFMIAQVTAAALVAENKTLAHPCSVDSIPTSANQEDHVSMATHAAHRLTEMAENAATIVGIELLAAAQGLEFHRPLTTSKSIGRAVHRVRQDVSHYDVDRFFAPDIEAAKALVLGGELLEVAGNVFEQV